MSRHPSSRTRGPRHQRGVGLIEVLLAVILISIGFLAVARMQVRGMNYSQTAYGLSQAKFMLLDMSERMRANRDGLRSNAYDGIDTSTAVAEPGCIAAATRCDTAAIAQADAAAWRAHLHAPAGSTNFQPKLPSGPGATANGSVVRDGATGVYTVAVSWAERTDDGLAQRTLSVQVMP